MMFEGRKGELAAVMSCGMGYLNSVKFVSNVT